MKRSRFSEEQIIAILKEQESGGNVSNVSDLARILALCAGNAKTPPHEETGFSLSLVAGAGFEPTTFRL